ncbi:MAG: M48 family metallopeptidase [Bryobacteraceae bacterium]
MMAKLLPRLGTWLGGQSRKPFRQAKWMWSWLAGTEAEAIQAEYEYGRECARQFAAQFSGKAPREKQEVVAAVGSRLADAVKDCRRQFHFSLVRASVSNAYALPGGFVFITEPLVDLCAQDPDELAFLLGHEMGHVLRGHARSQLTARTFLNAVTARLAGAGLMLRQLLNQGYSRELELEADGEGARLAAAAGFDPGAAARALQRLARGASGNAGLMEYFSSHPPIAERVRKLP